MHKLIYVFAAILAIVGLVMLLPSKQRGPQFATAAGPIQVNSIADISPQFAVMAELAPTFIAIQRVQMLNLANGLWLTDKQLDTMIDHLSELKRLENRYGEMLPVIEQNRDDFSHARALLADVESELVAGRQPSAGLEANVNSAVTELMSAFAGFDGLEQDLNTFKATTEDSIYEMLTDNQRVLVQEYVECIVPPVGDPNNPERIGQAASEIKGHMQNLRAMSPEQYDLAKDNIAAEIWQHILMHFPDQQQGKRIETGRLLSALDEVRAMPADEFALAGGELEKLIFPYDAAPAVVAPQGKLVNETEVRARIFKFFVENNPVEVLVRWRDNR